MIDNPSAYVSTLYMCACVRACVYITEYAKKILTYTHDSDERNYGIRWLAALKDQFQDIGGKGHGIYRVPRGQNNDHRYP